MSEDHPSGSIFDYVRLSEADWIGSGGGREVADEDIRRVVLTVDEALGSLDAGTIIDAKTIIGLQWLRQHRSELARFVANP